MTGSLAEHKRTYMYVDRQTNRLLVTPSSYFGVLVGKHTRAQEGAVYQRASNSQSHC